MTNSEANKKAALQELSRLATLPGNWDERGGSQLSPRASGNYQAFLDLIPEVRWAHRPTLLRDGGVKVKWRTYLEGKSVSPEVSFLPSGGMTLGCTGDLNFKNTFEEFDRDRLEQFLFSLG